jgi:predicted outer membrane protein
LNGRKHASSHFLNYFGEEFTMSKTTTLLTCLATLVVTPLCLAQDRPRDDSPIAERLKPRTPIDPAGPDGPRTLGDVLVGTVPEAESTGRPRSFSDATIDLDQFFAGCLLASSEGEIAISELAANRAKSSQVKEYAQQMVEEHRGLSRQLTPLATSDSTASSAVKITHGEPAAIAGEGNHQDKMTDLAPQRPARSQLGQIATGDKEKETVPVDLHPADPTNPSLNQLSDADRRIHQAITKRLRAELEQQMGDDFDTAYLHAQAVTHVEMIGATEVIQTQSPDKLGQIAQQAGAMAERHLKQVRQLLQSHAKENRDSAAKAQDNK